MSSRDGEGGWFYEALGVLRDLYSYRISLGLLVRIGEFSNLSWRLNLTG